MYTPEIFVIGIDGKGVSSKCRQIPSYSAPCRQMPRKFPIKIVDGFLAEGGGARVQCRRLWSTEVSLEHAASAAVHRGSIRQKELGAGPAQLRTRRRAPFNWPA